MITTALASVFSVTCTVNIPNPAALNAGVDAVLVDEPVDEGLLSFTVLNDGASCTAVAHANVLSSTQFFSLPFFFPDDVEGSFKSTGIRFVSKPSLVMTSVSRPAVLVATNLP